MQARFVRRMNAQSFALACGHPTYLTVGEAGGSGSGYLAFPASTDGQREVLGMAAAPEAESYELAPCAR
jgi:hypothetical protein